MTGGKDIVERLRELAKRGDEPRPGWIREAADEIERLRAKIEELEAESYSPEDLKEIRERYS